MSGFDNEVLYSSGDRLESSSAQSITIMQKTANDVSRINYTGNPEGLVSANPSSIVHNPVSGTIYAKRSGSSSVGWEAIPSVTALSSAMAPSGISSDNKISSLGFGTQGYQLTSSGAGVTPTWQQASLVPLPLAENSTISGTTFRQTCMLSDSLSPSLATNIIAQSNRIYFYPAYFPRGGLRTKIGAVVTTNTVSGNFRIGLYNSSGGLPSTPLVDSGNLSAASTGVKEATGLSFTIIPGWYWFCITVDSSASGLTIRKQGAAPIGLDCIPVQATDIVATPYLYYDNTFGALPTITQSSLVVNAHSIISFFYIAP